MKDFFDILVSLPTPLIRGIRKVLFGGLGLESTYIGWLIAITQLAPAIIHSTGFCNGVFLYSAMIAVLSVSALTAFMTAGGNEYEPNKAKVQGKMGVLLAMMFNATLIGTVVAAVLVGVIALLGSVNQPGSLLITAAIESAVCAVLVDYLLRRSEK
jgi:hypothetical protein